MLLPFTKLKVFCCIICLEILISNINLQHFKHNKINLPQNHTFDDNLMDQGNFSAQQQTDVFAVIQCCERVNGSIYDSFLCFAENQ